jgi:hypothetical protein
MPSSEMLCHVALVRTGVSLHRAPLAKFLLMLLLALRFLSP